MTGDGVPPVGGPVVVTGVRDVVVVGGGIAGLVAARELALAGLHPLVLEAWAAPGGAVGRHTVAGLELDAGAESYATRGGIVAELVAELGLEPAIAAPAALGAWVQLPSGPGTLPRTGVLGIPADPWAGDVRRTIGWAGAARASADRWLPAAHGRARRDGTPASLGELVAARMGRRVLDRLVTPIVSGVHAADPRDVDVDTVAPGLLAALAEHRSLAAAVASLRASAPAGAAVLGLVGGMFTLVDALVRDIAARDGHVEPNAQVLALERGGPREPAWAVRVAGAAERRERLVRTHRVVLALPGQAATRLLEPHLPDLGAVRPDAGADVVLATLVLDAAALDAAPRGTGVLVAPGVPGVSARALTHATAKWAWLAAAAGPGRHVVRLSYAAGSAGPAGPASLSLAELTDLALRDAALLLGVPLERAQVVGSARVRWAQSLPLPSAAHRTTVAAVRAGVAVLTGVDLCGSWLAGNGLAAVVADARATGRRSATNGGPGAGGPLPGGPAENPR